jgi:hypothetical protein
MLFGLLGIYGLEQGGYFNVHEVRGAAYVDDFGG